MDKHEDTFIKANAAVGKKVLIVIGGAIALLGLNEALKLFGF
jgi:hypothetical protein